MGGVDSDEHEVMAIRLKTCICIVHHLCTEELSLTASDGECTSPRLVGQGSNRRVALPIRGWPQRLEDCGPRVFNGVVPDKDVLVVSVEGRGEGSQPAMVEGTSSCTYPIPPGNVSKSTLLMKKVLSTVCSTEPMEGSVTGRCVCEWSK